MAGRSGRPSGPGGRVSTRMPSCSSCDFFCSSTRNRRPARHCLRSLATLCTRRDSSGRRRRESRITRSSGRRRGRPLRSVSSGLSAEDGSDADHESVVLVAQFLHVGAGDFAGDPSAGGNAVGLRARTSDGRRSDLAVERHGGFQRDQRRAGADVAGEGSRSGVGPPLRVLRLRLARRRRGVVRILVR